MANTTATLSNSVYGEESPALLAVAPAQAPDQLAALTEHGDAALCAALHESPGWVIDTPQLEDFEPGAVGLGHDWFRAFKNAGGEKVVFVWGSRQRAWPR